MCLIAHPLTHLLIHSLTMPPLSFLLLLLSLLQVTLFFNQHPDAGSGQRAVRQAVEVINGNIAWLSSNEATINNWLTSQLSDQ